ncbi:MAG TPA: DUF3426 domain-containing protein [Herbaspirillum sp.]|jgi:predicted Zn finger-like uncharacterized protein
MALATQCPFCQTTFRVAGDQLKLRGGLVRCGHCNEVFDGNAHLLQDQQGGGNWPQQTPASPPPTAPITPAIARANAAAPNYGQPVPEPLPDANAMAEIEAAWDLPPSLADNTAIENTDAGDALMIEGESDDKGEHHPDIPQLLLHPSSSPYDDEADDGDVRDWDAHATKTEPSSRHSPGEDAYRDERSNWDKDEDSDSAEALGHTDEPVEQLEFILAAQRRQRRARVLRLFMIVFSVLLIFTGLAQGVYLGRNRIAAAAPSLKPMLIAACRPLRCTVGLQKQIDQLFIESNEMQAATPDQPTLILNILLRNRADIPLAWPDIELTLNDDDEQALIRRVFTPAEYLPSLQLIDGGIAADGEQMVKLSFTMAQGAASGYRVYLFYP